MSQKLPLVRALFWIVGVTFICTSISHRIIRNHIKIPSQNKKKTISYIVQTGPQKEALPSDYFAELLDLSVDKPILFSKFSEHLATESLKKSPLILNAFVRKISPNIVYIDYEMRKPVAQIADFINTGIDKEGRIFPLAPFFSPKYLPELYLGLETIPSKQDPISDEKLRIAFSILGLLAEYERDQFLIKKIDLSKIYAPSLGEREIVLILDNEITRHFLRLSPKNYAKQLSDYLQLRKNLVQNNQTIDLRIPNLGYIHIEEDVNLPKTDSL